MHRDEDMRRGLSTGLRRHGWCQSLWRKRQNKGEQILFWTNEAVIQEFADHGVAKNDLFKSS
jgi:hypothetical protein